MKAKTSPKMKIALTHYLEPEEIEFMLDHRRSKIDDLLSEAQQSLLKEGGGCQSAAHRVAKCAFLLFDLWHILNREGSTIDVPHPCEFTITPKMKEMFDKFYSEGVIVQ